jgi:hypothetical protein
MLGSIFPGPDVCSRKGNVGLAVKRVTFPKKLSPSPSRAGRGRLRFISTLIHSPASCGVRSSIEGTSGNFLQAVKPCRGIKFHLMFKLVPKCRAISTTSPPLKPHRADARLTSASIMFPKLHHKSSKSDKKRGSPRLWPD